MQSVPNDYCISKRLLTRYINSSSQSFKHIHLILPTIYGEREGKHRFQLSSKASGKYKNQRVQLVLEEPVEGTSKWKQYQEYYYTLNISFTNDFDDF